MYGYRTDIYDLLRDLKQIIDFEFQLNIFYNTELL